MRYSARWLSRYVDLSGVEPRHFVNRVTLSVAEVEGFETFGAGLEGAVIARIVTAEPHPGANKLQVCSVDDGQGLRQVVCGAPNARAGLVTVLVTPGAVVRGKTIELAEIRGVRSEGMLCSASELGLSEASDGIVELDPTLVPGTPADEVLPISDVVFEVDNKSLTHRPDLWGYVGMARELAAWLGRPLTLPDSELTPGPGPAPVVRVADPHACPRYVAVGLSVPKVGPSPLWMQALLARSGVRAISNVVDVTNFVMLEWGNPLHAFDARELRGGRIEVRRAEAGEQVRTLDGVDRALDADALLICDGERPVALAGIMGLQNSEIVADTTELVLEAANFRSDVIRRTAMRLHMRTEASARFEKSLDPDLPPVVAGRFARLLAEIAPGTTVTTAVVDENAGRPPLPRIAIRCSYVNARLGTHLSPDDIVGKLTGLRFAVERVDEDQLLVSVPGWRATKDISIAEDLVEEIGRLYGYDNIPPAQPLAPLPKPFRHAGRTFHRRVRLALSLSGGFHELQLYSFDSESLLARIGGPGVPRIGVRNPISEDLTHLRRALLPGLLGALERNRAQVDAARLYEIGRVYEPNPGGIPVQPYRLALAWWGRKTPDWTADPREALTRLKESVAALGLRLGLTLSFGAPEANPWLHPTRSTGVYLADGTGVGTLGSLHPAVCDALGLGALVAAGELHLDRLQNAARDGYGYAPVAKFPALPMDLSVIVPVGVAHGDVAATIREQAGALLRGLEFVADFRGAPIPEGQKSLTWRLLFQAPDRTLAMTETTARVDACVRALSDRFGAWQRV